MTETENVNGSSSYEFNAMHVSRGVDDETPGMSELPTCIVCTSEMKFSAIGNCEHNDVCSECVQRLRIIHNDRRCCVCQQECEFVFISSTCQSRRQTLTFNKTCHDGSHDPSTAPTFNNVLPQGGFEWLRQAARESNSLVQYDSELGAYTFEQEHLTHLKHIRDVVCPIATCKTASHPQRQFDTIDTLMRHVRNVHGLHYCRLCVSYKNVFMSEQKLYTAKQLKAHMVRGDIVVDGSSEQSGFKGHPRCEFCDEFFYGSNELFKHMQQNHFWCEICRREHNNPDNYAYFKDYQRLYEHFETEHYPCLHKECLEKRFVVFESADELRFHSIQEHGGHMSRSQRRAAMGLIVCPVASQNPLRPDNFETRNASTRGMPGRYRTESPGRLHGSRNPSSYRDSMRRDILPTTTDAEHREGNFAVIDDDLGWVQGREASIQTRLQESFPSLQSQQHTTNGLANQSNTTTTQAPVVRSAWGTMVPDASIHTSSQRSNEGQDQVASTVAAEPDSDEMRRRQLAEAFGISDNYRSDFASSSAQMFSDESLILAKSNPVFVASVERQLFAFLRGKDRRMSFPPMIKDHRAVVHELCEHFGLVSCSYGQGARRHVDVFLTPGAARPAILLSHAGLMHEEPSCADADKSQEFTIQFTEVHSSINVDRILREFERHCTIDKVSNKNSTDTSVIAKFNNEKAFSEARNMLGGGLRGLYKIKYVFEKAKSPMTSSVETPTGAPPYEFNGRNTTAPVPSAWDDD